MENGNTLAGFDPRSEMGNQSQLFINLHQDIICTTKDKLQLSLQRFQAAQEIKSTVSACASLALTFLLTITTSTPTDALGLPASVWNAVFLIALAVSGIGTLLGLFRLFRTQKDRDIETFCDNIMLGNAVPFNLADGNARSALLANGQEKPAVLPAFLFFKKRKNSQFFIRLKLGSMGTLPLSGPKEKQGWKKERKSHKTPA